MFPSMKMEEYMESEPCGIFPVEVVTKQSAWVLGGPTPSYLCSVMPFSEETYKCCERDRWILEFSLLNLCQRKVILSN